MNIVNNFEQIYEKNISEIASIPLEIKINDTEPIYEMPIMNPLQIKNIQHKFERGSLAMVKVNKNRSSSTEFFFSLKNLPEFDGRYSVFGRIISGVEIINNIDKNDLIKKIELY